MNLIVLLTIVVLLGVAVAAAVLLRGRRSPAVADQALNQPGMRGGLRERAAAMLVVRRSVRRAPSGDAADAGSITRPDVLPAQALDVAPTRTLVRDWPFGLAVTALTTDSVGYPQQDVYYVQRNTIALARGLSGAGASQQAAALALSAVMTSQLGQTPDLEEALRESVSSANSLVRSFSRREPQYSDMAATLDVVFVAFDGEQPSLHFAHVGSSSIWLQRVASQSVVLLTESHTIDGGPLLRAIGVAPAVVADVGQLPVSLGDRIFLTTASRFFAFTLEIIETITAVRAGSPLHDCVGALAEAVLPAADPEGVTIVAAEITRSASFLS